MDHKRAASQRPVHRFVLTLARTRIKANERLRSMWGFQVYALFHLHGHGGGVFSNVHGWGADHNVYAFPDAP